MNSDFNVLDKVAICDSTKVDYLSDSLISDFVCYGYILCTFEDTTKSVRYLKAKAIGTDGKIYVDTFEPDGIYFQSEEEFLTRLSAEKSLHPEKKHVVDEMILALKVLSVR